MSYHKSVVWWARCHTTRQTFPHQLCKVCKVAPTEHMPSSAAVPVHRHLPRGCLQRVGLARQAPPPKKIACINLEAILTEGGAAYHSATRNRGGSTREVESPHVGLLARRSPRTSAHRTERTSARSATTAPRKPTAATCRAGAQSRCVHLCVPVGRAHRAAASFTRGGAT